MRTKELESFIHHNKHFFWYTPETEKPNISDELLLEHIINYADLITIKELFKIWGIQKAKTVFENLKGRKSHNIYPELYHFFTEYFKRVA